MSKNRSSVSNARSYQEIGEYWDRHDLGEVATEPVDFEVDLKSERHLYSIDRDLSRQIAQIAQERGVSPETLVNLWIQEKVGQTRGE